jgi:exopolysaccharide biosynthesis polyprenyl glycosylphosphotransferase
MNPPSQLSAVAEHRTATALPEESVSLTIDSSILEVSGAGTGVGARASAAAITFYERTGKRLVDLVLGSLLFLLTLPLLGIIALAIKLDSPGPVLFRSTRCGLGGRPFTFYKLRSMYEGAPGMRNALLHLNEKDGPVFKLANDPRITRFGRFIRRTSIDELPQLWNVVRGDMSLVGPRPPIPEEVIQYTPNQMRRLSVTPGLTCLWQISGRSDLEFDEWVRLDIEYIFNRSFATDMKILALTVPAVLSCRGAY